MYRNRMPSSAPRKPHSQAPNVPTSGNQTIFTRLASMASLPLSRSAASDKVPPMHISASGRVICAR
ncbi:hypothetical protein D3C81_1511880 [compost metagenome]